MSTSSSIGQREIMSDTKVYDKNLAYKIAEGLTLREFRCKCSYVDCTFTLVNLRAVRSFERLRELFKKPLFVNSAFRCQRHNKDVGGVDHSYHKWGSAMDLRPQNPKDLEELYRLAKTVFDFVKLYKDKGFVHCHMADK